MKKTLLLLALFLWTGLQVTFAQSRTVKGKVVDDKGEAVIGATVIVKGTTTGTVTDADGNYEITLTGEQKTLEIRYAGLVSQSVTVEGDSVATTKMETDATDIGEVSIYGSKVDKKSFTGAVSTITSKDIARRPITDISKALEGAAPGVAVTSGGGQPGASPDIQVRGQNTLSASGSPLIVLDGAPYSGTLVSINPGDVESMTVLKDASATAIYGSRGANGVILIVTKRGVATGKPRIAIDASVGMLNRFMPLYETEGSKDYLETSFQAWNNAYGGTSGDKVADFFAYLGNYNPYNMDIKQTLLLTEQGGFTDGKINPNASLLYTDSWFNELNRTGVRHNYNVSVSNGDKANDYYFSVGYVNEQGIVKNSSYDRISSRLNVNSKITPWLKAGISLAGTFENQRFFLSDDQQAYSNPFMTAQVMAPIYPVYRYDANGNRMTDPTTGEALYDFGVNDANNPSKLAQNRPFATNLNPIASLFLDDRSTKQVNTFGNTYMEVNPIKDFTIRSNFNLNYLMARTNAFQNMTFGDAENVGGRMNRTITNRLNYTFNQILTWKPTFSGLNNPEGTGHNGDLILGHETFFINTDQAQLTRTGFVGPQFQEGEGGAIGTGSTTVLNQLAMESYFAMLNYNYASKYYLSGSLRRDGSSRFAPDSRWGTFWSVGAGWVMNQESFLSDVSWIDLLKLRGSYGVTGNENLGGGAGYYVWRPRYDFLPNNNNPGVLFSTWGSPTLKWEGQYKFNVGFDFGFFKNRINGNIDFFKSGASNLLFVQPFAPSVGSSGIYANVGSMGNTGIELQLNADIMRATKSTDLNWNARLNLTHLKNKITEVQTADSLIGGGTILAKGFAVNSFFLPHYAGVNAQGLAQYEKRDGTLTADYGELTNEDRKILGSSFRDLEGSVTNTFTYRNFDLSFLVSFGIGGKFYDNTYARLMSSQQGQAYHKDILNAWKKPGDELNTDIPKVQYDLTYDNPLSDRFLVSNSFLNIKNVNLGYTLPASTLKRLKLTALRVYVAADNLFYLSARKGLDVQQSFFGASSFTYFPYRTVVFGLNLGL